jgi:predicted transcriptional regulator
MSTTTLRLPDEVKARIERQAAAQGKTAHALMIETLDASTAAMERRQEFLAEGERRLAQFERTGEYYELNDVREVLLARVRGESAAKPTLRKKPAPVPAKRAR